ncbi:MAG TPA: DUF11 domain-containing protein [Anaerolineae bacterium]|nr:DUF11 domain-containing protein [Anaerolineae bacterium]
MKLTQRSLLALLTLLLLPALLRSRPSATQGQEGTPRLILTGVGQGYSENLAVVDLRLFGYQPTPVTDSGFSIQSTAVSDAAAYAAIRQTGPAYAAPGTIASYEITAANYESVTRTIRLTNTLPPQLAYIPGSAPDLTYNPDTRALTWQGELAPGQLEYVIEESQLALPYLNLADFGVPDLCAAFRDNERDCDDVVVTFNLGVNGYSVMLYGRELRQLTLSSNGVIVGAETAVSGQPQWLPDAVVPNFLLAGLWRDVDMTASGSWRAAILSGLIEDYDVFYAQWHDAPAAADPDLTARHAIAIPLSNGGSLDGHVFYIYDNISHPAQTAAQGYAIGLEDNSGTRGVTYAYAPCCGDPRPAQGYPPPSGTALRLRPILFGAANGYARTFSYAVTVNGRVPETIANTAVIRSDSPDPNLAYTWDTHYLSVRWQTYLPLALTQEAAP